MLVDTSVWIDHFRRQDAVLAALLEQAAVECHPFVTGELACGSLKRRQEIVALLQALPHVPVVEHDEALAFVERHRLSGTGIGWIDAHLLASTHLAHTTLWTRDRRLLSAARALGVAAEPA